MPLSPRFIIAAFVAAAFTASALSAEGNAAKGRRTFAAQCAACHTSTAENRITGPALLGVIGRKAGSLEGFAFSEAMKNSGLTWDAATLEKYLAAPGEIVPGTTMTQAVSAPAARADLIAFLNTLTPASATAPAPAK